MICPHDRYMAVEGTENGLIRAIRRMLSRCRRQATRSCAPFEDGSLPNSLSWCRGAGVQIFHTSTFCHRLARARLLEHADLRVAPASARQGRLRAGPLFAGPKRGHAFTSTFEEAGLCAKRRSTARATLAAALLARWLQFRAVVTDGGNPATVGQPSGLIHQDPPPVSSHRVTGAGDYLHACAYAPKLKGRHQTRPRTQALSAAAPICFWRRPNMIPLHRSAEVAKAMRMGPPLLRWKGTISFTHGCLPKTLRSRARSKQDVREAGAFPLLTIAGDRTGGCTSLEGQRA